MQAIRHAIHLTEEAAWEMIRAARAQAQTLGIAVHVAVVDASGELIAYSRMDGASLMSGGIAQNKAYTAASFGWPTASWYPILAKDPASLHGLVHTPRLVIFGGGLPVRVEGQVAGAIGVSGGTPAQDVECAEAGIAALRALGVAVESAGTG
ncbi:MAG: heme-binding protein [Firmicutes bacterium]|nr:heme-binding protein [Alicyclobacillaceae bacterium]MCL6496911.1 heme-binding protein [Bacillota bacterium]